MARRASVQAVPAAPAGNRTRPRVVWQKRESHRSRRSTTQAHRPRGGALPVRARCSTASTTVRAACSSRATPGSARPRSGARRSPTPRRAATACCAASPSRRRRGCRSWASPTWRARSPTTASTSFRRRSATRSRSRSSGARGSGRPPDPTRGRRRLARAARARAEAGPLVLAVDDVQWLDAATARALAFAVRRLDGLPVGVVATVRAPLADGGPARARARARPRAPAARAARAAGPRRGAGLIETRLGHEYRRPTLVKIAQASRGNPLFALEIARALGPAPALEAGAPLPVPESLRELVAGPRRRPRPAGARARCSSPPRSRTRPSSSSSGRPRPPGWSRRRRAGCSCLEGDRLVLRPPAVRVRGLRAGRERPPPRAARAAGRARRRARGARAPPGARRRGARRAASPRRSRTPPRRRARAAPGRPRASCSSRRAR